MAEPFASEENTKGENNPYTVLLLRGSVRNHQAFHRNSKFYISFLLAKFNAYLSCFNKTYVKKICLMISTRFVSRSLLP